MTRMKLIHRTVCWGVLVWSLGYSEAFAKVYKGAELRTKIAYTYGRFEARIKSTPREGILSSLFTYHEGVMPANWNEIDIEIMGRYEYDVQFNAITPGQVNHVGRRLLQTSPHREFHTYAFEWTPNSVVWFIDGQEVYRQEGAHIQTLTRPQKLMMNIWNPEAPNWAGEWNDKVLPAFAYYDWASYAAYTPGAGTTGTGNNFTPVWRDDFNAYDAGRWDKATHTFDGNGCDFVPENVVYRDGYMILCLTDASHLGYVDVTSPSLLWSRRSGPQVLARFSEEVDPVLAESAANYMVAPGATVLSARLLDDNCTVELTPDGMVDTSINYNLIVLQMRDQANPPNQTAAQATPILRQRPLVLPVTINVGGGAVDQALPDQAWDETVEYGYLDGQITTYSSSLPIGGTAQPWLYRSERWGLVYYKVRVPNGTYAVTLQMAENYFSTAGSRMFDISIENTKVKSDLDVYSEVGKNNAYSITVPSVDIVDGVVDIHFGASIDNSLLNAVVIEAVATGINDRPEAPARDFELLPNYPNPFNSRTTILFALNRPRSVTFRVYDLLGKRIVQRPLGLLRAGTNRLLWDGTSESGSDLPSGTYIYAIESEGISRRGKMVLMR